MNLEFVQAVITAALPAGVTLITAWQGSRQSKKLAAKQSILQMIMEDQFNWYAFKELPRNFSAILKEYDTYHNNGGNGEITLRVEAYKRWYDEIGKK